MIEADFTAAPPPAPPPDRLSVDVCVVGAGPVGATLACRLAAAGLTVAVIDRAALPPMEHPAFDGRAYAIAAGTVPLLQEAGLWEHLPQKPAPIRDIRVTDGRVGRAASRLFLHFDHRAAADPGAEAPPFGWMIEARSLRVALNAALHARPGLHVFAPAEARVERHAEGARVRIAGGPEIACRLVVAAEGRQSPLREAAGIAVTHLPYDQTGIVCAIRHEKPHHATALEHFLPGGPFAQLPMGASEDAEDGGAAHVSAIVWTERTPVARALLGLDAPRFAREIARRLGPHLGEIRVVGRRWSYPLSAMIVHRYTDTRLVLVGDAAHGIHPIAGQGLNLGFRDVACLSALLMDAAGGDAGDPALLAAYQRARRPDNLLMLGMTDGLDRLFSTDRRPVRMVRDLGLGAVQRLPGLKRMFMRRAMGLAR
ncbi:MAG: UbiH/UbiF/VisC/COQ6 family ubiquinone biosynthesis hydroxylase [Rhodospirillales bacterium]|nr:UbiH/UbiF/VisC/COQ6 family ubiquinone biosynthesis hydroxylase [Rhodospirillales bacterium]